MSATKPLIGITLGDYNGIGPEVIIKALSNPEILQWCVPIIYGSQKVLIYYKNANTYGKPTKTLNNYAVNGALLDSKYFWYDHSDSILLNDQLNEFFNHFFMEKIFDITLDYKDTPLMNLIIMEVLKDNKEFVKNCFKDLHIQSMDDLTESNMALFEMLQMT